MDPGQPASNESLQTLIKDLQNQPNYQNILSIAQRSVLTSNVHPQDFVDELTRSLQRNGVETSLRNATILRQRQLLKIEHEPLIYMKKAECQLERKVAKNLLTLRKDLKENLSKQRSTIQTQEIGANWDQLSVYNFPDTGPVKMLYDYRDIYEAVSNLRDPDYNLTSMEENWNVVRIPLKIPDVMELMTSYKDLVDDFHLGLGSSLISSKNPSVSLLTYQTILGEKVAGEKDILISEEFVQRGCPPQLRGTLWKQILQSESEVRNFHALRQNVIKNELLVDRVVLKDISSGAGCDEHYFIFEDTVYQILLCFLRDPHVNQELGIVYGNFGSQSRLMNNQQESYPQSGVLPFGGISMLVALLCYLDSDSEETYYLFRSLYLRHWRHLTRLSSHSDSIVSLSLMFQRILQETESQLWVHCLNHNIQPLKIAMNWMTRAFSGFLLPEQLLHLWDLILGYGSLKILPVLAAAVFSLRRENLLRVENQSAAQGIFACIKTVCVVPLVRLAVKHYLDK